MDFTHTPSCSAVVPAPTSSRRTFFRPGSWRAFAGLLVGTIVVTGCVSGLGPRALRQEQTDYNEQVVASSNEQLLLNLVRLRYNDTPLFLGIGTIVAQYSLESRIGGGANLSLKPSQSDGYNLNGGATWSERPTVTLVPLQGSEFATQMMSPIPTDTITILSQTGWSIERLLMVCVQRINGVGNASSAMGPTPDDAPNYKAMAELAQRLRRLQKAGLWAISHNQSKVPIFWLREPTQSNQLTNSLSEDVSSVRRLLELPETTNEFTVTSFPFKRRPLEVALRGKTLLGTMFYLSQAVEVPIADVQKGVVNQTHLSDGTPFDWSQLLGGIFRVQSAPSKPTTAWVAIKHRGHWFYIDDTDRESKTTFNLLTLVYSMQTATLQGKSPLLTLPISP